MTPRADNFDAKEKAFWRNLPPWLSTPLKIILGALSFYAGQLYLQPKTIEPKAKTAVNEVYWDQDELEKMIAKAVRKGNVVRDAGFQALVSVQSDKNQAYVYRTMARAEEQAKEAK